MSCFISSKEKVIVVAQVVIILLSIISVSADKKEDYESIQNENVSCEKTEGSEFPDDLFTETQRKYGAIVLHVILFLYSFGAIAVVCTEYFLPTIKCICEDLNLSDDVAAATFMSIATSSPELFTNIISTFITDSDIGIGHVIGNAYYDMFFVAALGGLVAAQDIVLEWWPLVRDCSIYFVVAITLTGVVWDGVVKTYEAVILLLLYVLYFLIMFNNQNIIKFLSEKFQIEINQQQSNENEPNISVTTDRVKCSTKEKEAGEEIQFLESEQSFTLPPQSIQQPSKVKKDRWHIITKIFSTPIRFLARYTIPDVRIKKYRKYYPAVFILCVAWIGVSTYLGTWMISVIGETIGVPDLVMGMIFMAAGGSVVEAYSVYYKAKRGECSIGLSNSMGCNNIDATMCLALPWFIKTLLPIQTSECSKKEASVVLGSSLIHVNCILLVISVVVLFAVLYLNKFKLNKKLGFICGILYAIILVIAITVESHSKHE